MELMWKVDLFRERERDGKIVPKAAKGFSEKMCRMVGEAEMS